MQLKGMTWDHPRAYDPLIAAASVWEDRNAVAVQWERRSLQDFESFPVRALAETYDLIVVDHPHVGQVAREECLRPFASAATREIAAASLGASFHSYLWEGQQLALPIDAAAQVQAWRPDRLPGPLRRWEEVTALARLGRVACPMRPPHSLMSLYTLCGLLGGLPAIEGPALFDLESAAAAYRLLAELVTLGCCRFGQDPIAVLEGMARADTAFDCAPLIYGYASYAREGFRPARLAFADLPVLSDGPRGSALGGTGIAVSALRPHQSEAAAFALWLASGPVQAGLYADAGGQPGHADAWDEQSVNAPVLDFYRETRETLDSAWVRPRHDGYMAFQQSASLRLNQGLRRGEGAECVIAVLNRMFEASL